MTIRLDNAEVMAIKDGNAEYPIPSAWRTVIRGIVDSFVRHDYQLNSSVSGIVSISPETASQVKNYIHAYGATLIELPDETWNSSVCIWMGTRWDALIDLWTLSEGRSDLVLNLQVSEANDGFVFSIYMVYVP